MLEKKGARPEIGELIKKIVENPPQEVFLEEYFCANCCKELALLALERLIPTVPGKFLIPI